jgi:hypothetical protein
MADGIECATFGERAAAPGRPTEELPMPHPPSALARLLPARRRRPRRETYRFVTRAEMQLIVLSRVPTGQSPASWFGRFSAWTLYSRWEWALATARVERARRRAHPPRF